MKTRKNQETSKNDLRDMEKQVQQMGKKLNDVRKVLNAIEKVGPDMVKVSEFLLKKHSQVEVQRLITLYNEML